MSLDPLQQSRKDKPFNHEAPQNIDNVQVGNGLNLNAEITSMLTNIRYRILISDLIGLQKRVATLAEFEKFIPVNKQLLKFISVFKQEISQIARSTRYNDQFNDNVSVFAPEMQVQVKGFYTDFFNALRKLCLGFSDMQHEIPGSNYVEKINFENLYTQVWEALNTEMPDPEKLFYNRKQAVKYARKIVLDYFDRCRFAILNHLDQEFKKAAQACIGVDLNVGDANIIDHIKTPNLLKLREQIKELSSWSPEDLKLTLEVASRALTHLECRFNPPPASWREDAQPLLVSFVERRLRPGSIRAAVSGALLYFPALTFSMEGFLETDVNSNLAQLANFKDAMFAAINATNHYIHGEAYYNDLTRKLIIEKRQHPEPKLLNDFRAHLLATVENLLVSIENVNISRLNLIEMLNALGTEGFSELLAMAKSRAEDRLLILQTWRKTFQKLDDKKLTADWYFSKPGEDFDCRPIIFEFCSQIVQLEVERIKDGPISNPSLVTKACYESVQCMLALNPFDARLTELFKGLLQSNVGKDLYQVFLQGGLRKLNDTMDFSAALISKNTKGNVGLQGLYDAVYSSSK